MNIRRAFKLFLSAGLIARRGEEDITMSRRIGAETLDIFFELLVAIGMCGGKDFSRHQIGSDALNVSAAAGAKRQAKAASIRMKFDQPLNGSERDQDREGLVELLNDIKRFAGQRIVADRFKAQRLSNAMGSPAKLRNQSAVRAALATICACRPSASAIVRMIGRR